MNMIIIKSIKDLENNRDLIKAYCEENGTIWSHKLSKGHRGRQGRFFFALFLLIINRNKVEISKEKSLGIFLYLKIKND